eukprot:359004-Chlamydomonas_euryale.AAC.2
MLTHTLIQSYTPLHAPRPHLHRKDDCKSDSVCKARGVRETCNSGCVGQSPGLGRAIQEQTKVEAQQLDHMQTRSGAVFKFGSPCEPYSQGENEQALNLRWDRLEMLRCDWPSQTDCNTHIIRRCGWDRVPVICFTRHPHTSGGVDGTVCQSFASYKTPIHPLARRIRPPSWPSFTKLCAFCSVLCALRTVEAVMVGN